MDSRPKPKEGIETLLQLFEHNVKEGPNDPFLGTRPKNGDGTFGPYQWLSYADVDASKSNLARGLMLHDLCPEVGEENFRFCGIWAKNR